MINTIDQRTFYLDRYNSISTITIPYEENTNIKQWISDILNISTGEIITPKILLNVLRDYQNTFPKQIVSKIGKIIATPPSLFHTYLKCLMLYKYNPVSIFNQSPYILFENNNFQDIFNRALQKHMDSTSYLYASQIISLIALTETRIQLMKKNKQLSTNFNEIFEQLTSYEIVFNSSKEYSVIELNGLITEIEYMAMVYSSSIIEKHQSYEYKLILPTLILKVSEGIILFNDSRATRILGEILDKNISLQFSKTSYKFMEANTEEIAVHSNTEEIIPPISENIKQEYSEQEHKESEQEHKESEQEHKESEQEHKESEQEDYEDEQEHNEGEQEDYDSYYDKIKKIKITKNKENFMMSGNMHLGISEPLEQFPPSP